MAFLKSQKARITSTTMDSPVLTTPALGTPASGVMTNMTGAVEASFVDDAITIAKMDDHTDGNIITYDASGNPTYVATGSDGQVLTSTGAGSPPAFETASVTGGLAHIQTSAIGTSTTSGTTFADFFDSDYKTYYVVMRDIEVGSDAIEIRIQFNQTSDGTTEAGAAYEVGLSGQASTGTAYNVGQTGSTSMKICPNIGNAAGEAFNAKLVMNGMQNTSVYAQMHGTIEWQHGSDYIVTACWAGFYSGNYQTSFQGLTFLLNTGSFSAGTVSIYGITES
jgi:hypothetical protein